MKLVLLVAALICGSAFAATDERDCGRGVYCADPMICVGHVQNVPKGMVDDYTVTSVGFRAFKSTKNIGGGQKQLVDSLNIDEQYHGDTNPDITLAEAWKENKADGGWYTAPMRVRGKKVTAGGVGFGNGWTFTIKSSEQRNGYTWDVLEGSMDTVGDVVADHTTTYVCWAKVVKTPSRVDDFTR